MYFLKLFGILLILILFSCKASKQKSVNTTISTEKYSSDPVHLQATDFIIEGKKAELQSNFVLAEDNYLKCIKLDPENSTAHYLLSRIYLNQDINKAILFAKKAYELDENEICFQNHLLNIYKQQKKWNQAIELAQNQLRKKPEDPSNYFELANIYIYSEQLDKAISVYENYEKQFGFETGVVLQKKQIFLKQKKYSNAVVETEKLITQFPENTDYYGMAADIYQAMGNKEKAFEYYSKILKINPEDGKVHLSLADYYFLQGKKEMAFEETKKAIGSLDLNIDTKIPLIFKLINSSKKDQTAYQQCKELVELLATTHPFEAKALATKADFHNQNGDFFEARNAFRKVIQLDSSKYLVWEQLILLEKEFADYPSMLKETESAIGMFSQYSILYYFNALANFNLGNYKAAEESLESGKMFCYSPKQQADFFVLSAQINFIHNKKDIAYKYLESALELDPNCSSVLRIKADFLLKDDVNSALENYNKAIKMDSLYAENYFALAKYYFQKNNMDEAFRYLHFAQKRMPFRVDFLEFEGDLFLKQNKKSEAIEVWKKALIYSDFRKKEIETKIKQHDL